MPAGAEIDAAIEQGRSGVAFFAEFGGMDDLPLIGGADDRKRAALAEQIDLAVAGDGRTV
jgi:hypothetical protein